MALCISVVIGQCRIECCHHVSLKLAIGDKKTVGVCGTLMPYAFRRDTLHQTHSAHKFILGIVTCWYTMEYCDDYTEKLGANCVNELKDAVDKAQFTKKNCLELSYQLSRKVFGDVKRRIDNEGYDRSTIDVLLGSWFQRKPGEVCVSRIVSILKSADISNHALALELEKGEKKTRVDLRVNATKAIDDSNNNSMELDNVNPRSPSKFERNSEWRSREVILKKAQKCKEEALKVNEETHKYKEEAHKCKEDALKVNEEAQKSKEEAQKSKEEARRIQEQNHKQTEANEQERRKLEDLEKSLLNVTISVKKKKVKLL